MTEFIYINVIGLKFTRLTTLNDCQCLFVCWMCYNFIKWWYLSVVLQLVILPPSGWNEIAALSRSFTFSLLIKSLYFPVLFSFFRFVGGDCDSGCVSVQGLHPSKVTNKFPRLRDIKGFLILRTFAVFKGESFRETLLTLSAIVKCDGLAFGAFLGCITSCFTLTSQFSHESVDLRHEMSPFSLFLLF